jgi:hypothetical protein
MIISTRRRTVRAGSRASQAPRRRGLAAVLVALACSGAAVTAHAEPQTSPLLFDRDMTVGAGAAVSTTVGDMAAAAADAFVPVRLLPEEGPVRRGANIAYRLLRFTYFDAPQEAWLWVATHEVFGHGSRLRERFDGRIGYRIAAPPPYGPGGGLTRFTFDREPTAYELMAVSTGGMEASAAGANLIATRAFRRGRLGSREAMRLLGFELDTFSYVRSTRDAMDRPGHDVESFLRIYNELADRAGTAPLEPRTLRREVLVALANPMLGVAVYGIGRYLWDGTPDVTVPALSLRGVRVLPLVRYRLTPYGTEWALTSELAGRVQPTQIDVRIGRTHGATPWGIGLRGPVVAVWREWSVQTSVDVWRQPPNGDAFAAAAPGELRLGAQVRARAERPLLPVWFSAERATVVVELGAKSSGFVPGEPLGRGVTLRAGVGLPVGR